MTKYCRSQVRPVTVVARHRAGARGLRVKRRTVWNEEGARTMSYMCIGPSAPVT